MTRDRELQEFLDAAAFAFGRAAVGERSKASVAAIFRRLETPGPASVEAPAHLPACASLPDALAADFGDPALERLARAFAAIEPRLKWIRRADVGSTASANYRDGHANTMIFGPGGLEDHRGLMLGVSLMAPHVRYPDHDHAPEETYLVMSDGEFMHGDSDWFVPGIGGSFYNTPNIRHAMRSGETPLFAFWALQDA